MTDIADGFVVRRSERIIDCPVRTTVIVVDCAERPAAIAHPAASVAARRMLFIGLPTLVATGSTIAQIRPPSRPKSMPRAKGGGCDQTAVHHRDRRRRQV